MLCLNEPCAGRFDFVAGRLVLDLVDGQVLVGAVADNITASTKQKIGTCS
jgi:hypothetical protein